MPNNILYLNIALKFIKQDLSLTTGGKFGEYTAYIHKKNSLHDDDKIKLLAQILTCVFELLVILVWMKYHDFSGKLHFDYSVS